MGVDKTRNQKMITGIDDLRWLGTWLDVISDFDNAIVYYQHILDMRF
jgi:hypothetical protein